MSTAPSTLATVTPAAIAQMREPAQAAKLSRLARFAAQVYAAQGDREASQRAKEIYLRSARQCGSVLSNVPRSNGGRPQNSLRGKRVLTDYQEAMNGAGITDHTANVWQKLAEIPDEIFEAYLMDAKYKETEYTFTDLFKYAQAPGGGIVITLDSLAEKLLNLIRYTKKAYPEDGPELLRMIMEREL